MGLFKKALVFTDIHFGMKSNSTLHNQDCEEFVKWAVEQGKLHECETCIFMGDWHHHRASLSLQTMHHSLRALEMLSAGFDNTHFITGNHDLYYRDKRDIYSYEWAQHIPNVHIHNEWFEQDDVILVPWLVGDDYKRVKNASAKYMFGHFELPHFKMNAMVEMPDHGDINAEHFTRYKEVFSGHFHLRQKKNNINYIGNAFPHNFSDAGDDQRGVMILDWDGTKEYISWPDQPLYSVMDLSDVIDFADERLKPKMHVRVNLDIEISYEEANYIKEKFITQYGLREMSLIPNKQGALEEELNPSDIKFESVDQIITEQIIAIDSEFYDNKLLLEIYRSL